MAALPDNQFDVHRIARGIVLCLLAMGSAGQLVAQSDAPEFAPAGTAQGGNRALIVEYRRVAELLDRGDLRNGLGLLQQILDELEKSEDAFVRTAEGSYQSLKGLLLRRLKELPQKELELYELRFGPDAARLLADARQAGAADLLESIARRYFYTRSGEEATRELALRYLDAGQPLAAALQFNRLLRDARNPQRWEPRLSVLTALSWARAGMPAESLATLQRLAGEQAGDVIAFGDTRLPLPTDGRLPAWVTANSVAESAAAAWPMFLGASSRVRESAETTPHWAPTWRSSVFETFVATPEVEKGMQLVAERVGRIAAAQSRGPAIPAQVPIVVAGTVVFRQPGTLKAVDAASGELLWESAYYDPALNGLFDDHGEVSDLSALDQFIKQYGLHDATSGTLSSDGRYVYAVEETNRGTDHVLPPSRRRAIRPQTGWNKLRAYEVETGLCDWVLSGKGASRAAAMLDSVVFLGPPLPFGGDLLTIVASRDEIRLLQIHMDRSGEFPAARVVWSQGLAPMDRESGLSRRQRLAGLSPSYGGGLLICPTCAGRVVALDPATRRMVWQYRYPTTNQNRFRVALGPAHTIRVADEPTWLDSAVRIAHGFAVCTPRDSDDLHCLDVSTGAPVWRQPRGNGLYVAAVTDQRIVVVGEREARAWQLNDGSGGWPRSVPLSTPSGRGARRGNKLSVPLTEGRVATIDLQSGRLLVESARTGQLLGNLVAVGDAIVSQSLTEVAGFGSAAAARERISAGLRQNPADVSLLIERAALQLQAGEVDAGLSDLQRAVQLEPQSPARGMLLRALAGPLRRDFAKYEPMLAELEAAAAPPGSAAPLLLPGLMPTPLMAAEIALSHLRQTDREQLVLIRLRMEGLKSPGRMEETLDRLERWAWQSDPSIASLDADWWIRGSRVCDSELRRTLRTASDGERRQLLTLLRKRFEQAAPNADVSKLLRMSQWCRGTELEAELLDAILRDRRAELTGSQQIFYLERLSNTSDSLRAAQACVRLVTNHRDARPRLARECVRRLETDFSDVACDADRTGREAVAAWKQSPDFTAVFRAEPAWPTGGVTAIEPGPDAPRFTPAIPVNSLDRSMRGGWTFFGTTAGRTLVGTDEMSRERLRIPLEVGALLSGNSSFRRLGPFVIQAGSTLVVRLRGEFHVYDIADSQHPKLLWSAPLIAAPTENAGRRTVFPRAVGPVCGGTLLYQRGEWLVGADLWSGEVHWSRRVDLAQRWLLADDRRVLVLDERNKIIQALNTFDGRREAAPALPTWWPELNNALPLRLGGRRELLTRHGTRVLSVSNLESLVELTLTDLAAERVVWQHQFPPQTIISNVTGGFVAAVEPSGQVHVFATLSGRAELQDVVDPEPGLKQVLLHVTPDQFVLFGNAPPNGDLNRYPSPTVTLNGFAHGFDRWRNKRVWTEVIDNEGVRLTNAAEILEPNLPVVLLMANGAGRNHLSYRLLNCRTGETIFSSRLGAVTYPLVRANRDQALLDFRVGTSRVQVQFRE